MNTRKGVLKNKEIAFFRSFPVARRRAGTRHFIDLGMVDARWRGGTIPG